MKLSKSKIKMWRDMNHEERQERIWEASGRPRLIHTTQQFNPQRTEDKKLMQHYGIKTRKALRKIQKKARALRRKIEEQNSKSTNT